MPDSTAADALMRVAFRKCASVRPRGLDHVAPSRREGGGIVHLARLFDPVESTSMARGTLHHAWFRLVRWLEDGLPDAELLRRAAEEQRSDLSADVWSELEQIIGGFRNDLAKPEVAAVLSRSAYSRPDVTGFPGSLKPCWSKGWTCQVEREQQLCRANGAADLERQPGPCCLADRR